MRTFKSEIKFSGVGLMSGKIANVVLKASSVPGIWFKRVDLPSSELIPARWDNVQNIGITNTTVGVAPNQVQTIEHFMAALFVCGIDSAVVEIDAPEFPIMDGGAKQFIEMFKNAKNCGAWSGVKIVVKKEIVAFRQEIIKKMPVLRRIALWLHGLKTGRREDGWVKLSPDARGLVMDVTLDYPDKIIGRQKYEFVFDGTIKSCDNFEKQISQSRTFGRIWEWEYLKKHGNGHGANENNVLAINETSDGTLNKMHFPDEFVRHKLIDAAGDLFASGGMIVGKLESVKGSHGLNNLVLKKLFSDPSNYDIIG